MKLNLITTALEKVGYVPATALTAERERHAKELAAIRQEHAFNLELLNNAVSSAATYTDLLQKQLKRAVEQHDELDREHVALINESRRKDDAITQLAGDLEEANVTIADLQRERPQLRLLESPARKPAAAQPSEGDRVVHEAHEVEIVCRLVTLHFEGTRKYWVLRRDNDVFKAAVHDKKFLDDVHEGKPLAANFLIRARFTETGYQTGDGEPYTKRSLEEVLGVITPDTQTNFETVLPLEAGEERASS
jgi:hypothetical protein